MHSGLIASHILHRSDGRGEDVGMYRNKYAPLALLKACICADHLAVIRGNIQNHRTNTTTVGKHVIDNNRLHLSPLLRNLVILLLLLTNGGSRVHHHLAGIIHLMCLHSRCKYHVSMRYLLLR